jgi:hypothetical protein
VSPLHVARVALTARGTIPDYAFAQTFSSSLQVLGEQLAQQVHDYVQRERLGYYPPLEYFLNEENQQPQGVEPYLLDAVQEVAQWAVEMGRREILSLLQPVFSSVVIDNIQATAFTMPTTRFGQTGALKQLAQHYTPNSIKFDLTLSLLQKHEAQAGLEKAASHMVLRWLNEPFQQIEVTSVRLL